MNALDILLARDHATLEDFWQRRRHAPAFWRRERVFGREIEFASNHSGVLAAVDHSLPLYSTAPADGQPPWAVQFVVREGDETASIDPALSTLPDQIQYSGADDWLLIQLGPFGVCHVDLRMGKAVALLTPALAARPALVSLYLLNTILTNFFIAGGYAMLHASCLLRGQRALLLMAPHNTGKSTTALHCLQAGYRLLSDSMIFLSPILPGMLLGFPVGKIKLRPDMLHRFPHVQSLLTPEQVRGEIKFALDLRQFDPAPVCAEAIRPQAIDLCLLRRSSDGLTRLMPAPVAAILEAVMANSLYYDSLPIWQRNLGQISRLLAGAACYDLAIGVVADDILSALAQLD